VCDLNPGDTLLVPAYWWVHSELLQPDSCCLTVKLQPGPERCYSKGALLLQLSRMIEVQIAAEVGPANVRRRIMVRAWGRGREWEAGDGDKCRLHDTHFAMFVQLCSLFRLSDFNIFATSCQCSSNQGPMDHLYICVKGGLLTPFSIGYKATL
jgi:hypothetical protein